MESAQTIVEAVHSLEPAIAEHHSTADADVDETSKANSQLACDLVDEATTGENDLKDPSKKKYSVISQNARERLLELVLKKRMRIKEAAKSCGLKFSTSKAILATYRKEGRVGKKKTRARKTRVINTVIVAEVNPYDPTQTKIFPMMSVSETKMLPSDLGKDGVANGESSPSNAMISMKQFSDAKVNMKRSTTMMLEDVQGSAQKDQLARPTPSAEHPDQVTHMLDVASTSSKVTLLNEIQGMVMKLNLQSGNSNAGLIYLQNSLECLSMQYRTSLQSLLTKKRGATAPSAQQMSFAPQIIGQQHHQTVQMQMPVMGFPNQFSEPFKALPSFQTLTATPFMPNMFC